MADTPISHPNLSLMTFSGNDPNQNATAFWNSVENKILFSLGQRPADNDARRSYDSRQRSLFGSLLTDTSLEWFNDNVTNATTWAQLKDLFLNRFTDGRDQFKHRIDAENAARQDGELIKNYFHRIKSSVDRGWPESIDVTVHVDEAAQNAEKTIQTRQRSQKYIDFSIKGLRPLALKQKAHEYMKEHPNANWDQFTNHVITKDLTFIVATDPANKSTTDKMTSLETQIKELTKLIKNQEVSAINDQTSFQRRHPDIKGRPNSTQFCEYCRTNGHSISRCSKKQVQDKVNKLRKELTTKNERRVSFETDYKRNRRPNNFSNQSNPNPSNRFWDNQNRSTNNSNPSQNNYGIRHNYNYNGNYFQKANAQPSFNNKRPQTYDDRYPRENKFRENEQVAKQFYDQENRQFNSNPRGRPYNTGSYNSNNSRDSTRPQSPNFRSHQIQSETTHWVEEEVNYCDAITDFFPLNY